MLADAGLPGEHDRVGAVEDRVGDVGGLRAGRPGVLHHRLQHLRGHDHRLAGLAAHLDRRLLHDRHLLERQLHAQVAAGDHHAVERLDDPREVLHRLGLLDLGQDRDPSTDLVHDRVHVVDVVARCARTTGSTMSTPIRRAQRRSSLSLSDSAGTLTATPGEVDALVVADRPTLDHAGAHAGADDVDDLELDLAVVDQDGVAGVAVVGQALVGGAALRHVAEDVLGRDRELGPVDERDRPVGEAPEPDLGTLQVRDDAHAPVELLGGTPHVGVGLGVHRVLTVGHVQARDVHARLDELLDLLVGGGGRTQGAHDLRSTHGDEQ